MSLIVDIRKKLGEFYLNVEFKSDGGVCGLLGASGSGKSLTLMCIAGIIKPDSGRIALNERVLFDSERRINLTPQKRRIGYLFQNYALFPNMNVSQNILCGLHNEKSNKKREYALQNIINMLQLSGLEKHRPNELSGGQQQRVALARILVGNPDMIILDEPFSALDTHLRGQLQLEVQVLLKRFGKDALLVTHNRNEAYHLCHKIALLDIGKVLIYKNTKQLFSDPESRQAALITGCKNVASAKKISEFEVEVSDCGVRFTTSQFVRDDICAIGIRAHYFNPKANANRYPVRFIDEMEGPFEYIIQFRYENQLEETQNIWWRIPKEKRLEQFPDEFGVAPVNIMLLYR